MTNPAIGWGEGLVYWLASSPYGTSLYYQITGENSGKVYEVHSRDDMTSIYGVTQDKIVTCLTNVADIQSQYDLIPLYIAIVDEDEYIRAVNYGGEEFKIPINMETISGRFGKYTISHIEVKHDIFTTTYGIPSFSPWNYIGHIIDRPKTYLILRNVNNYRSVRLIKSQAKINEDEGISNRVKLFGNNEMVEILDLDARIYSSRCYRDLYIKARATGGKLDLETEKRWIEAFIGLVAEENDELVQPNIEDKESTIVHISNFYVYKMLSSKAIIAIEENGEVYKTYTLKRNMESLTTLGMLKTVADNRCKRLSETVVETWPGIAGAVASNELVMINYECYLYNGEVIRGKLARILTRLMEITFIPVLVKGKIELHLNMWNRDLFICEHDKESKYRQLFPSTKIIKIVPYNEWSTNIDEYTS